MSVKIVTKFQKVGVVIEKFFKVLLFDMNPYKNIFEECFWMPRPYYGKTEIYVLICLT